MKQSKGRILVTGAAGFIGSRLCAALLGAGYRVVGLERPGCDLFRVGAILGRMKLYRLPGEKAASALRREKIDGVIHLAAYYRKRHAPADVGPMIRANIEMPALLLEAAAARGVKWFVNTGTFFEYAPSKAPLRETSAIAPRNLYASTKTAFDALLGVYVRAGLIKGLTIRLFSPYGPGDNPDKVVPYLIDSLLRGKKVRLAGPSQKLAFIHVDDIVDAYVRAAARAGRLKRHEAVNIGGARSHDALEAARTLEAVSGRKLDLEAAPAALRTGGPHFRADLRKARALLGWRPRYGLREGLAETWRACAARRAAGKAKRREGIK